MYQIKIGNIIATLRLTAWQCDDPHLLNVLNTFTNAIAITGSVPDIEEHIVNGLRNRLDFTVEKHVSLPDTGPLIY